MKENKVGTYSFVAEPFHVDFTGRLFMGVLGNHLLNCAGFHATERGFGMAELNESNYTWVLSRLAIELEDMPAQYEEFSVDTWVENVYRLFTDRNFAIYGKDGKVYGYARSVWAMINMDTRKPADLLSLHGGDIVDYIETEKACPIEKPGRIKVSSCMPVRSMDVYYSDIDINGHVNSIKYIEHVLDLFSKDWYAGHVIRRTWPKAIPATRSASSARKTRMGLTISKCVKTSAERIPKGKSCVEVNLNLITNSNLL